MDFGVKQTYIHIVAYPHTSCETLGKFSHLSEPPFSQTPSLPLKMDNDTPTLQDTRMKQDDATKYSTNVT
jgi:hypothetical protein